MIFVLFTVSLAATCLALGGAVGWCAHHDHTTHRHTQQLAHATRQAWWDGWTQGIWATTRPADPSRPYDIENET